jgi:hypothetical protein
MKKSVTMQDDGFEDCDWDVEWIKQVKSAHDKEMDGQVYIYKRSSVTDTSVFIKACLGAIQPGMRERTEKFLAYMILYIHGKREVKTNAIDACDGTPGEQECFFRIKNLLQNDIRKKRVFDFIQRKDITKRLINYFVVQYCSTEHELSYYVDLSNYPPKLVGEVNNDPNQPEILKRIEQGEHIVFINLHQQYKNSRNKNGQANRLSPYSRHVSMKCDEDNGGVYSLCELNFYLFLDGICGFEVFYLFESDIRAKKLKYDENKRTQTDTKKNHKRKFMDPALCAKNYKTHVLQYKKKSPFSSTSSGYSYTDMLKKNL